MFDDARSKRVMIVAHCLLNQNAISDGTADFASQFQEIIEMLMKHQVGIIQLPCPEMLCLGLERGDCDGGKRPLLDENSRIRDLLVSEASMSILRRKAEEIARQVADYQEHGFEVLGLIGVDRSPSCGVETTSRGRREEPGRGVFVEILEGLLSERGIALRIIGTKTSQKELSADRVQEFLKTARRVPGTGEAATEQREGYRTPVKRQLCEFFAKRFQFFPYSGRFRGDRDIGTLPGS